MTRRPRFAGALVRPRLLAAAEWPCLVLTAPAGGGKTVLATQLADRAARVVWVRPPGPATSAQWLVSTARAALGAGPGPVAVDPGLLAESYLDAAGASPVLLVVDDADRVDGADLSRWLAETVPLLDEGSGVVVCARDRPAGLVGRLGVSVRVLDAAALAFTREEVAELAGRGPGRGAVRGQWRVARGGRRRGAGRGGWRARRGADRGRRGRRGGAGRARPAQPRRRGARVRARAGRRAAAGADPVGGQGGRPAAPDRTRPPGLARRRPARSPPRSPASPRRWPPPTRRRPWTCCSTRATRAGRPTCSPGPWGGCRCRGCGRGCTACRRRCAGRCRPPCPRCRPRWTSTRRSRTPNAPSPSP